MNDAVSQRRSEQQAKAAAAAYAAQVKSDGKRALDESTKVLAALLTQARVPFAWPERINNDVRINNHQDPSPASRHYWALHHTYRTYSDGDSRHTVLCLRPDGTMTELDYGSFHIPRSEFTDDQIATAIVDTLVELDLTWPDDAPDLTQYFHIK